MGQGDEIVIADDNFPCRTISQNVILKKGVIKYEKMNNTKLPLLKHNRINYLLLFIIITACFSLCGFANDITNPMVKAFSKIFRMNVTQGAMIQLAFYRGYFAMAFPAALFIKRFSYKSGILLGLALYAVGAFLFFPAMMSGNYYPLLAAYFVLTSGLSFLETIANPDILTMGPEENATRRLNMAQAFNPIGSLMFPTIYGIASRFTQKFHTH